jgi:hypothetical protein
VSQGLSVRRGSHTEITGLGNRSLMPWNSSRDMQEMNNKYWFSVLIIVLMILYVLAIVAQIRVG